MVGERELCLASCRNDGDCRADYICLESACVPRCSRDLDCGTGMYCQSGDCLPLPGRPIVAGCARDAECSSRTCDANAGMCRRPCTSEDSCPGETCYVNPADPDGDGVASTVQPICVPLRAGGAVVGSPCQTDDQCERGSCQLGVCTVMCQASGQCALSPFLPMTCASLFVPLEPPRDAEGARIRSCILRSGTLTVDLGARGGALSIGVPSHAVGMNIFVAASGYDTTFQAGITNLRDPEGGVLYRAGSSFYGQPLRYAPAPGSSMVLVPNAPAARLVPGIYRFTPFAQDESAQATTYSTRVRFKLGDGAEDPVTAGRVPLHVLMADLAGGCGAFDDEAREAFERRVQEIFAAVGLRVEPISYRTVAVPSVIGVLQGRPSPELFHLLEQATAGDDEDVLELVLIRKINSDAANGFEVLGIAGGIPGATGIPGTPHSGAALSLAALCFAGGGARGGRVLGTVAAHELGHSMGLFHNVERDGTRSALGDDVADGKRNLMYYSEESLAQTRLSPNQAAVLLANPAVGQGTGAAGGGGGRFVDAVQGPSGPASSALGAAAARDGTVREVVEGLLGGYEPDVPMGALAELGTGVDRALIAVAEDGAVSRLRRARAMAALGAMPSRGGRDYLRRRLRELRGAREGAELLDLLACMRALGKFGREGSEDLAQLLGHSHPEARAAAALSLGDTGMAEMAAPLVRRLSVEPDRGVREALRWALLGLTRR